MVQTINVPAEAIVRLMLNILRLILMQIYLLKYHTSSFLFDTQAGFLISTRKVNNLHSWAPSRSTAE